MEEQKNQLNNELRKELNLNSKINEIQVQLNKNEIRNLLNQKLENKEISNWRIIERENEKYNIYIEKDYKIESILFSKRKEYGITIFKEFDDDLMGESSFNISESQDLNKLEKDLNEAIFICSNSKNKKYKIPTKNDIDLISGVEIKKENYFSKRFFEDFNSKSLGLFFEKKLNLFKNIINQKNEELKDKNLKVKLNTIEFLNSISSSNLELSTGIEKDTKSNSTYMEFVLTLIDLNSNKEFEYIVYKNINNIYYFNFEVFFENSIEILLNSNSDFKIENFDGNVLLSDKAVVDFFNPDLTNNSVIGHSFGRLKFMGISKFEIGDEIIKSKYDKLNIVINSLSDNSANREFDEFGVSAKKIELIKDSKLKNYFSGVQYASYLNLNPSGPFGTIEVGLGSKKIDELKGNISKKNGIEKNRIEQNEIENNSNKDFIEILSFSSFVPDLVSGDFSAEIRLGYYYKHGEKKAFKGGLFSGNIFKLLEEVEFSKEVQEDIGFKGPKTIKFHNGNVVGF